MTRNTFTNNNFPLISTKVQVKGESLASKTTSGMLSIVGERESVHAKLEARTPLRYVQYGLHMYTSKSKGEYRAGIGEWNMAKRKQT